MLTIARLEELERAAARCIESAHPEWVLSLTAGELAELCAATRYGHDNGTWVRLRREEQADAVPAADSHAPGDEGGEDDFENTPNEWGLGCA